MKTKYKPGDLVYDPRLNMTGMVMGIEEKRARARRRSLGDTTPQAETELWYQVMLFGDPWCEDGETRAYAVIHGDSILERYKEEEHKGLSRDEVLKEYNSEALSEET
tara:strand:+ start:4428 stop:4748 length:321 start_codon:yes stop_codon:yes gene_type:complete